MRGKTAVKERKAQAAATVKAETCRHHWVIETPRGALSEGRCKLCGEERQFRNSASDYIWDDDSSSGYSTLTKPGPVAKIVEDDGDMMAAPRRGRGGAALVL